MGLEKASRQNIINSTIDTIYAKISMCQVKLQQTTQHNEIKDICSVLNECANTLNLLHTLSTK